MALSEVAHLDRAVRLERFAGRTGGDDGARLGPHRVEQPVDRGGVEIVLALSETARDLEGDRRAQKTDRRTDARVHRHQHARHAELLREARGVQRRRAAEGDHGAALRDLAALDRMHSGCARHVLFDDFAHACGGPVRVQFERHADRFEQRALGGSAIKRECAGGKRLRIDAPEGDVGIGDRGLAAAAAVAHGPGVGARALRADADPAERVQPRDRAAARADFDHLGHRDADRQAAAPEIPPDARHFELARLLRTAVADEADLRGRSAHVE